MNWRRWSGTGVLALALVYGGFLVGRVVVHQSQDPSGRMLAQGHAAVTVGLSPGDVAPNFMLISTSGQTVSLRSLKGHPVWINFWTTWCRYCNQEVPEIVEIKKQYGSALDVYGIDEQQAKATVVDYMAAKHVNYPVLLDTSGVVAGSYGVEYYPTSVFIGPGGHIAGVYPGAILSRAVIYPFLKAIMPVH